MTLIKFKNNSGRPTAGFPYFPGAFDDFFGDVFNNKFNENGMRTLPAVNITEDAANFSIEMAAPGFSKGDFKVEVDKGVLTISAEKKEVKAEENKRYARKEFAYNSFKRTFGLPDHVEGDKIVASYTEGILNLMLPKKEEAKEKPAKEITIS